MASTFNVGDRVRIRNPKMTSPKPSKYGTIKNIDGAYIAVHPSRWPPGTSIELYPCEIEALT
ncbi:MAG: hypothetical protein AB7U75_14915 [Hyphomicrobiaceae bacterium]